MPAEAIAAARESVAAALAVTAQAPVDVQAAFAHAASSAFVDGMSIGCLVAAGVAFVGAVAAALFLPGRLTADEVVDLTAHGRAGPRARLTPRPRTLLAPPGFDRWLTSVRNPHAGEPPSGFSQVAPSELGGTRRQ